MTDPWAEEERLRQRTLSADERKKLDSILRRAERGPDQIPRPTKAKLIALGVVWTLPLGAMIWLAQTAEEERRIGLQFATAGVLWVGVSIAIWILIRDIRAANRAYMAPYRRLARQYSWDMRYGRRGWLAAREDEEARDRDPYDYGQNRYSSTRRSRPWSRR